MVNGLRLEVWRLTVCFLTSLRSSGLAVPFYLHVLVIALELVGWVEAALPAHAFQGENGAVPASDPPSTFTPRVVLFRRFAQESSCSQQFRLMVLLLAGG
jgi:hypothetical protein